MADVVMNRAKGAARQLALTYPNAFQVILLKAAQADATLRDYANVSLLLANAGNTEADFTNYAPKTGLTVTVTPDDANDWVDLSIPDQTWVAAGGALNNTMVKALVCVQTGADNTTLIPLAALDFTITTDGNDVILQFNANGFYRAQ